MEEHEQARETWVSLIQRAAAGHGDDRSLFSRQYMTVVHDYIAARWRGTAWADQVDDAVQQVFVECFKDRGALESYDPDRKGGFRAFLFGVIRNVTHRVEREGARRGDREGDLGTVQARAIPADDATPSKVFDRAWAMGIVGQAKDRMRQLSVAKGAAARRRWELLRQRFEQGQPIREIAAAWQENPADLHRWYRRAREEFEDCLRQVIAYHGIGDAADTRAECDRLVALLG